MAEGKKSFLLYVDQTEVFEQLTNEQAGKLIKHIFAYVNDEDPKLDDPILNLVFTPIKQQLKRDLKRWGVLKDDRSKAGILGNLKRYNPDLYDKVIDKEMTIDEAQDVAKHRKASQSDTKHRSESQSIANVAVNVNDNVTVNGTVNDTIKHDPYTIDQSVDYDELLKYFNQTCKMGALYVSSGAKINIRERLYQLVTNAGMSLEDAKKSIGTVIRRASEDKWYQDSNNLTLEFITREEQFTKLLSAKPKRKQANP